MSSPFGVSAVSGAGAEASRDEDGVDEDVLALALAQGRLRWILIVCHNVCSRKMQSEGRWLGRNEGEEEKVLLSKKNARRSGEGTLSASRY